MSQQALAAFMTRVSRDAALQQRLSRLDAPGAAQLAQRLGYAVCCGDLLRYESRAFAWQLSDAEYELIARLQCRRRHWWQACWSAMKSSETEEIVAEKPID